MSISEAATHRFSHRWEVQRVIQLQTSLENKVHELEVAIAKVKRLHGLLPICSYCKKVRDDNNYWQQIESYISEHSEAEFSHGICPQCYEEHIAPLLKKQQSEGTRKTLSSGVRT